MAESPPSTPRASCADLEGMIDESSPGQPTVPSGPECDLLFSHFRHLIDSDTRAKVTSATLLAFLYRYDAHDVDNNFLGNINGKSDPLVGAQMLVKENGRWTAYPSSFDDSYQLRVRFNTLLSGNGEFDAPCHQSIVLEFPFNNCDGIQLSDFACDIDAAKEEPFIILSEVNGATSEGLTKVNSFADRNAEQAKVIEMVRTLCNTNSDATIVLSLDVQGLEHNQRAALNQVVERLPGGTGTLLPSIGRKEWSNVLHYIIGHVKTSMGTTSTVPNLMSMQDCGITFSSLDHFCAVHQTAELIVNEEVTRELRLWARAGHQGSLYELKGQVVLAMKFGKPMKFPSGRRLFRHPKIPNDLEIKIDLSSGEDNLVNIVACHERDLMGLHRHTKYDAYFKVTSHSLDQLSTFTHNPNDPRPLRWRVTSLKPHEISFWINSVYRTSRALRHNSHWHALMLGQSFASLNEVDVVAAIKGVAEDQKASAMKWLLEFKPWNSEQHQVIDNYRTTFTTLLLAIAVYLVKFWGRAIISAAENGHIENLARVLDHITKNVTRPDGKPHQSLHRAAVHNLKGHIDGTVGGLANFMFARLATESQRDNVQHYTLCNAVSEEADKGELVFVTPLHDSNGNTYGSAFDVWERLRELTRKASLGIFPWKSEKASIESQHVYNACEGFLIMDADIINTTACNAGTKEIVRYWGEVVREYDFGIKALGVFIDNADSCRAMETWNVITSMSSIVFLDHVEIFFAQNLPALQEHFRERTSKEVMVIVAYSHARAKYAECMHGLQEEQGYVNGWYPRIRAVDGSKGHAATMAIFDGSMQHGDRMGFLDDLKRCNGENGADEDAPFYKLRQQLVETGQVIDFSRPGLKTIDRLTAKAEPRGDAPSHSRDVVLRSRQVAFGH
ncbi:hypothetical protein CERZMDRAFT_92626 [Cercospora zeae-maydis SCOH1-5]|uniref:Uncharacterized protein n=1 Tax=Cercospora zeae-maydis SCOH1-5 TaxID=717836 RepID=A0A6A6FX68_9PEZI|nr:hypothetical protein CERZMDRAFT_92626 [Cercospora zeae-maydis SCOH1-5]